MPEESCRESIAGNSEVGTDLAHLRSQASTHFPRRGPHRLWWKSLEMYVGMLPIIHLEEGVGGQHVPNWVPQTICKLVMKILCKRVPWQNLCGKCQ
ncbi:hypothetical protein LEMLEM_LOCUS5553 [Lemmus lemmus]